MLETNNPYMFGSSTTTTTTTTTAPNQPSPAPPQTSSSSSVGAGNSSAHQMQPPRPMHHHSTNYYMGKGGEDEYYHNHQHASRINPAYIRHTEEPSQQQSSQQQQQQQPIHYTSTYKPSKPIHQNNNTIVHQQHNEPDRPNNYMRPSVHVYPHQPQQHIKSENSPHMLPAPPPPPPSSFMKSRKAVDEPDWYERENKSHRPPTSSNTTPAIIPSSTANITMTTTTLSHTAPMGGEVSTLEAGDNKKIKRRKEMTGIMEDLNKDFLKKREKLYVEKMHAINQELKSAHQDAHPSYLDGLKDLEAMRRKTINDGVLFRKYQNEVTDNQFQLEIYQAEEEYTAEIQDIREKLFASLDEKRRKLKEEKDNCDLAYDVILESQSRLHKRNLRKREKEHPENKSSKKKQLTGPALVFKLKDDDILSDIQAMRNGLSSSNNSSTTATTSATHKKTNSSNKKK
ncbi:hypothetical protein MBANPS3_001272 [Mucor bainieri]